jgi:hypothetical protein
MFLALFLAPERVESHLFIFSKLFSFEFLFEHIIYIYIYDSMRQSQHYLDGKGQTKNKLKYVVKV